MVGSTKPVGLSDPFAGPGRPAAEIPPERAQTSPDRLEQEINKYDVDQNGVIDSGEVQRIVDTLVQEQGKGRNLRTYVAALAAIVAFVLVCNVGMAFAMANLTRQTSIQRGVMVVADTGEAVQTMSTEFALDEHGVLRASALPGNDSEVTEGRRLLEEGRQTNAVTTAPLTDNDGVLVSSTGATVATSPLTDSAGVMLSGDGSPVQSQMASYTTDINLVGGLAVLFGRTKEELKSITGWTATMADGSKINLQILGVERQSVDITLDPADAEQLATELANSTALFRWTVLRFMTNHYKYSMLAVFRMVLVDETGAELVGSERYELGMIERGTDAFISQRGQPGNVTAASETAVSGRRLLFFTSAVKTVGGALLNVVGDVATAEDPLEVVKDKALAAYNEAKDAATSAYQNVVKSVTGFIDDAIEKARELWRWVESLPGEISSIPGKIVDALKDLPWLPDPKDLLDGFLFLVKLLVPLEGNPPGICAPFCKLASWAGYPRFFAGNEIYLYEDFNYKTTTTLNNIQACFQITKFSLDLSKIGVFLGELFSEVLLPILESVAEELEKLFNALLDWIKGAIESIKSAAGEVKKFLDDFADGISNILGRRRRALLMDAHGPASQEEISQAVSEWVDSTVTRAASRKLLELEGKSGPQMNPGELGGHQLTRQLEKTVERMMEHGHAHVRRSLTEGIPRRQLLDWSNLAALDELEVGFTFNFEQTIRLVTNGGQMKYISGNLLTDIGKKAVSSAAAANGDTGDTGSSGTNAKKKMPKMPLKEKKEYMVLPGVSVIGEMVMDFSFPYQFKAEGYYNVDVTLHLKDMRVLIDVMKGRVVAHPGNFLSSVMSTSDDGEWDTRFNFYASGRIQLKMLAMVAFRVCLFGNCLSLEVRLRDYFALGFDAIAATCDSGVDDVCGDNSCASFANPGSRNFFGTVLTDDVEYPADAFQCIADSPGMFFAGGMWLHSMKPSGEGKLDFPSNLLGSVLGGSDCTFAGGDLDDVIDDLDTEFFNIKPEVLYSGRLGTMCLTPPFRRSIESGVTLGPAQHLAVESDIATNFKAHAADTGAVHVDVAYLGCYSDEAGPVLSNVVSTGLTMSECVAAALQAGATSFGLQHPAGHKTAGEIECWFGDIDSSKAKVDDAECQEERWMPRFNGTQYPYHGAAGRTAVYQLTAPIRYLGCWPEEEGHAFTEVSHGLTMEACAAWAASLGYNRFGLQHPEHYNSTGVECWTGPFDASQPTVVDAECKGESWNPKYHGKTFRFNGKANRNAVYRLGQSEVAYVGCWSDDSGRSLPNKVNDVTMDECAAIARREGSRLFGLQHPQGYSDDHVQCWHGDLDESTEQRPDAECQSEDWLPRLNGEKAPFNGGPNRNAIYALDPGPVHYEGCYMDEGFAIAASNVSMEDCAAMALAEGSTKFALKNPGGYKEDHVDCWHGDVDDKSKPKVDSSRCKAESWNPTYRGHTFKYNGANKNNAVYQLSAPARYMGCWSDTDGRAFSDVITGLTMQACADATRELGSAWFGLQYPEAHTGDTVECWIGSFDASKPKVDDSECKAESWNPTAWGQTYKYNGAESHNAVYVLTQPARYVGCWSDTSRTFTSTISGVTMETCATYALGAGSRRFALQYPDGYEGEAIECWFGEFNPSADIKVADSNCKGQSWNPTLHGVEFSYNGGSGYNAVYEFFG